MNPSAPTVDFGKLPCRVAVTALMVAAGTATVVTGQDHGLGQLAVTLGAVGGNMLAANIHETWTSNLGGDKDVLRNHDLSLAVGKAIAAVIDREAAKLPSGMERARLQEMAQKAPERWPLPTERQDADFADIAEVNLPNVLSIRDGNMARVRTLEIKTWESLVRQLEEKHELDGAIIRRLAQLLHEGFAVALFEILKADFAASGKAFAALALMMLSGTKAKVDKIGADVKILLERSQEQICSLRDLPVSSQHEIPRRNLCFTGRAATLEEMLVALQPGVPVALTGTPGIGKTEAATEFIYRVMLRTKG